MANENRAHKASRQMVESSPAETAPQTQTPAKADQGFFTNAANFLLSRLPWFKDRYESWSKAKKVVVALLLYLVILPVIPIVIAIVMYVRDPEGFKKSKAFPILSAIIVAQLAAFGLIAAQPPKVTAPVNSTVGSTTSTTAKTLDNTKAGPKKSPAELEKASKESAPSGGQYFENCTLAFKAGVHDIKKGDPSYRADLDRDNDGYACEK